VLVAFAAFERVHDFLIHLRHERIERLGTIERNRRNAAFLFVDDRFVSQQR